MEMINSANDYDPEEWHKSHVLKNIQPAAAAGARRFLGFNRCFER